MTLMEVALVLALIVIVASFCWPAINKAFSVQRLKKSADIVRTQWCKARVKAMTNDRIVLFRYEMGGNRFRIEQLADASSFENSFDGMMPDAESANYDTPLNDPTTNTSKSASPNTDYPTGNGAQALPQGITFRGCEIENDSRAMTAGANSLDAELNNNPLMQVNWSAPIYFYPDGTASSARLQICNDRNCAIELALRGMTGVVKIGEIIYVEGALP
jgi:hypothetical protein